MAYILPFFSSLSFSVSLIGYLGTLASRIQRTTSRQTDERLGLVTELISGIQMIKVYAWEKWIRDRILKVRDKELKLIRISGFIRGIYMTMSMFVSRLMVFSTLLAMVLVKGSAGLNSANVFMISAYFSVLGHAVGQMFVRGVAEVAAVKVSIKRLESYLMANENQEFGQPHDKQMLPPSIEIKAVTAYWQRQIRLIDSKTMMLYRNHPPTLNNVTFKSSSGNMLVGIVGAVGSGKTSLLELLMGELPVEELGTLSVSGCISYAPQESWIFNGTIRENIVYDEPWEKSRYNSVIEKCALKEDFQRLPAHDETVVGERGISLSGGQRARVNLARAIYRRADIYLLDDPLSAVDTEVGRYLFDDAIGPNGYLRDSIRLLVTHQMEYLKYVDWIIVMDEVRGGGVGGELLQQYSKCLFVQGFRPDTGPTLGNPTQTRGIGDYEDCEGG